MNKRKVLLLLGGSKNTTASIGVTTTGAQTVTISALTVDTEKTLNVDWGDGTNNDYTGAGARTHNYAGSGTWAIRFDHAEYITVFNCSDDKVTLNSKDIKRMVNVTDFRINSLKAGTFDSADVSAWRPTLFRLYSMPAGYVGTFDSADISAWRPSDFILRSMPAGYVGTFNSTDVSSWTPSNFRLYSMPAGYAGTFNSTDISAWTPTYFYLYSMPVATYTITITANGFAGWVSTTDFQVQNNSLNQTQVNQILADFWAGFATRTIAAGLLDIGGSNAAPTGIYQPANPPTTGLEYRYELLNDSQNINPTKKWATVTVTA